MKEKLVKIENTLSKLADIKSVDQQVNTVYKILLPYLINARENYMYAYFRPSPLQKNAFIKEHIPSDYKDNVAVINEVKKKVTLVYIIYFC